MACEPSPIARARRPIRQAGHPPAWGSPIARSASDRPTGRAIEIMSRARETHRRV